jgi:hypothetical protein
MSDPFFDVLLPILTVLAVIGMTTDRWLQQAKVRKPTKCLRCGAGPEWLA